MRNRAAAPAREVARNPRDFPINTAASRRPRPSGPAPPSTRFAAASMIPNGATRDVDGTHRTGEGAQVVSAVKRTEAASCELVRASHSATDTLSGESPAPATEGFEGQHQPLGHRQWGRNRLYFPSYTCTFGGKIIPLEVELR
jgi:hypothetical protein